jgi:hypothetical protein
MGPILDMVAISHAVVGASCEELERCVNMGLLHPFTAPVRAHYFASSAVTPQGYKPGAHAHAYVLSHELLSPPRLCPYA